MFTQRKYNPTKAIIISIMCMLAICSSAQKYKVQIVPLSCFFVAGACKATTDVLRSDYSAFQKAFPNANPQFWDYNISWQNKYKNGDPTQGEKFWQSTGVLSPLTDGFHLIEMPRKYMPVLAICLKIGDNKRPLKHYIYDALIYSASYGAGFNFMWKVVYNKN